MKNYDSIKMNAVRAAEDAAASSEQASWALSHLAEVLEKRSMALTEIQGEDLKGLRLNVIGASFITAQEFFQVNGNPLANSPESFIIRSKPDEVNVIGTDARGLVYGLLELADRVQYSEDPVAALTEIGSYSGGPANPIRSISRSFCSEIEDKPWFYDKSFWEAYLTELATHRFNRLHLTLGISYDYGHDPNVRDNYFGFVYPYFVSVPGYEVRVKELAEGEREHNLEMLRFISREAKRRGIHFQLGMWNHAYKMADSPDELHTIEGVDAANHAVYCRDALGFLLKSCPDIDGVTIRTHYEGGIPEPSHVFWSEVMKGLTACGRTVEIDMHPKGVDAQMLEVALDTGMPVIVSPKFWAEHMGLPYHQAAIRTRELPVATTERADLMSVTQTYRRFTRYGYADYLNENRKTGVLHRIWPGTQRVLLWGDPAIAAGYGRSGSFCGSLGVELCEPMSFKARKTSGTPGGRELYKDEALQTGGHGWKKYLYTYRVWGRLMYNPNADSGEWRRYLQHKFQAAAADCEQALAHASRILPLITTAHLPSASNNYFWPEMYNNLAIVRNGPSETDFDTPEPHTFGAVSPLDTGIFYGINEYVEDFLQSKLRGKVSPLEVADRVEALAEAADRHLASAASVTRDAADADFRRWSVDIAVQAGLGHFFAHKLRAGVSYALFERTGNTELLEHAISSYHTAKAAWEQIILATKDVYRDDITFGYKPFMKGHWADRLAAIEEDIQAMEQVHRNAISNDDGISPRPYEESASARALTGKAAVNRYRPALTHESPESFRRGEPVQVKVNVSISETVIAPEAGTHIALLYRHTNQSEAYQSVPMLQSDVSGIYTAVIPGNYTDSPYPIVYIFELRNDAGDTWLAPGLEAELSNQPYYVLREQV
ncbi:hypothetical protein O9H85_33100 [Paenibacillus filicis]|uniref:Beta-hexosaminidase bacterial type N-terminal domain-containing protein n=1 Tax=Paenibacillus gyeongsangnamensis TaxID=3388067 RepID=A0ABT4QK67_9BACL|nr:hypothetical protein [Paenibacillus filicis]MCZ8517105.1 hypothetical protein [Paenibacillus filicis]